MSETPRDDPQGMDFDTWRARWFEVAGERGHTLKRNEDGDIDQFVVDGGFHNGPGCTRCGWATCMHCLSDFRKIPRCES